MSDKHTPGPWSIKKDQPYIVLITQKPLRYAIVNGLESTDNARLMSAAPEMKEALIKCACVLSGESMTKNALVNALEATKSALIKATGK